MFLDGVNVFYTRSFKLFSFHPKSNFKASIFIDLGDPEAINYTTVGSAVTTITSNLNDMTRGMRLMAALIDNENDADNLMKVIFLFQLLKTKKL